MSRIAVLLASSALAWMNGGHATNAPALTCSLAHALRRSGSDPAVARSGIDATLRAMTAAVLAGDADAYLTHVWRGDANWAKEQENWAADLKRHVPREFTFELRGGELTLSDGWAEGEARMSWAMEEGGHRSVDLPVRFAQGGSGWQYAGEKWEVLGGDRVRVLFPEGFEKAARVVVDELPAVRERVHDGFELTEDDIVERVQEVKLYASMEHLQQSIYLSYKEPLGGWNEPGEAIKLLAIAVRWRGSARKLLAHEYGHVATFEFGDQASQMPWWALEGVAELSAEAFGEANPDDLVRLWARNGELLEWDRLADFRGEAREHTGHVYKQGQHMLGYVSERWGRSGRNAWLTRMAQGESLDRATRGALGVSFDQLDREWRESLEKE